MEVSNLIKKKINRRNKRIMKTAKKIQLLKEVAPKGFQFSGSFFTEDCENITDICIETNQIWTWKSFTVSCGCCSDTTEDIEDLGLKTNFRKKLIFACSSHLRES